MLRRIVNPPMRVENIEPLMFLQRAFLQIGQAKVATSAEEARGMNILGPQDRVVLNRDHLLAEAKKEVLHMVAAGYKPPAPEPIYAAGRDALAALRIGAWSFKEGNYITQYDHHIASKLAYVMCGGELTRPQWVSEQYILDLEREAILSLFGEEKTQARMWSLLQTGKPLACVSAISCSTSSLVPGTVTYRMSDRMHSDTFIVSATPSGNEECEVLIGLLHRLKKSVLQPEQDWESQTPFMSIFGHMRISINQSF